MVIYTYQISIRRLQCEPNWLIHAQLKGFISNTVANIMHCIIIYTVDKNNFHSSYTIFPDMTILREEKFSHYLEIFLKECVEHQCFGSLLSKDD